MTFSGGRARVEHCVEWKAQRIGMGGGSGDGGSGELSTWMGRTPRKEDFTLLVSD